MKMTNESNLVKYIGISPARRVRSAKINKNTQNISEKRLSNTRHHEEISEIKHTEKNRTNTDVDSSSALESAIKSIDIDSIKCLMKKGVPLEKFVHDLLLVGCLFPSIEIVNILMKSKSDITEDCDYVLDYAIRDKNWEFVNYVIKGMLENHYSADSVLRWACSAGRKEVVQRVLDAGVDIRSVSETAIRAADKYNHFDLVRYLKERGADIHFDGDSLLFDACRENDARKIDFLVQLGGYSRFVLNYMLMYFSFKEQAKSAAMLSVKLGEDVEESSFYTACESMNFKLIKFLFLFSKNKQVLIDLILGLESIAEKAKNKTNKQKKFYMNLVMLVLNHIDPKDSDRLLNMWGIVLQSGSLREVDAVIKDYKFENDILINSGLVVVSSLKDYKFIKYFLKLGADVHYDNDFALRAACVFAELKNVKFLVKNGAHVDFNGEILRQDVRGCLQDRFAIIKWLIKKGADIHSQNEIMLRKACESSKTDINMIDFLVKQGANLSVSSPETTIEAAARGGQLGTIEYLVKKGVDLDIHLNNSLSYAIQKNHTGIVKYIIAHAKDITPFLSDLVLYAFRDFSREHAIEVIKAILDRDIKNKEKIEEKIFYECIIVEDVVFLDQLIELGFNIHSGDEYLFRSVCWAGNMVVIRYLLTRNTNIHILEERGLRRACEAGLFNVVIFLVQQGADIHVKNDEPLRLACMAIPDPDNDTEMNNHLLVVKYLLSVGANIHVSNDEPLRLACTSKSIDLNIVKYLVEKGADVSAIQDSVLLAILKNNCLETYNYIANLKKLKQLH